MEFKELNILDFVIREVIGEQEYNDLKTSLVTKDNYQNFLAKFFEIIIGQEKTISLDVFLELHKLSDKLPKFQNKATDIFEEVAELVFEGYTSPYTKWLLESKNEVFLTHLSFLKDLGTGVTTSERSLLRKKLSINDKIGAFELSDQEIKIGLKLLERKRLQNHFEQLHIARNIGYPKTEKPRKLKHFTIFIFLVISSFAIAFSIPKVRSYIIKQTHELFNIKEKEIKNVTKPNALPIVTTKTLGNDTTNLNESVLIDSATKITVKALPPSSDIDKKTTFLKKQKARIGNADTLKNLKDYDNYFSINAKNLEYLEGVWDFQGIFSKDYYGYNATKLKFAIIKSGDKYEMIWLNKNGTKNNQFSQFYLNKLPKEGDVYSLLEYAHSKEINHTKVYLNNKKHIISFEININAERFEFPNTNSNQIIQCKFIGKKRDSFSF